MPTIHLDGGQMDAATRQLSEDYLKRLQGPWKTTLTEHRKRAPASIQSRKLLVLDERGAQLSSPELSSLLTPIVGHCDFVVGGSHGHSSDWPAHATIALSKMVLPHRLAVVMLCEQIYRAYTLSIGHPYHHA